MFIGLVFTSSPGPANTFYMLCNLRETNMFMDVIQQYPKILRSDAGTHSQGSSLKHFFLFKTKPNLTSQLVIEWSVDVQIELSE